MIRYSNAMLLSNKKESVIYVCGMGFEVALFQMLFTMIYDPGFTDNFANVGDAMIDFIMIFRVFSIGAFFVSGIAFHIHLYKSQAQEWNKFILAGSNRNACRLWIVTEAGILDGVSLIFGIAFGSILLILMKWVLFSILKIHIFFPIYEMSGSLATLKLSAFLMGSGIAGIILAELRYYKQRTKIQRTKMQRTKIQKKPTVCMIHKNLELKKQIQGRWKKQIVNQDKGLIIGISITYAIFFGFLLSIVCSKNYWENSVYDKISPYDLSVVMYQKNPEVSISKINQLLKEQNRSWKQRYVLNDVRDSAYTFFDVEDVNKILHTKYQIPEGKFLQIYRTYGGFGKRDFLKTKIITEPLQGQSLQLTKKGEHEQMLFGYNHSFADQMILLNTRDFQKIKETGIHVYVQTLWLYNFKDKTKVTKVINAAKKQIGNEKTYAIFSSKVQGAQNIKTAERFFYICILPLLCIQFGIGLWQYRFLFKKINKRYDYDMFALQTMGISSKERVSYYKNLMKFCIQFTLCDSIMIVTVVALTLFLYVNFS